MKKILVPCDFSLPSREALKFAVNIAAQTKGEVIALHVIYVPVIHDPVFAEGVSFSPEVMTELEESAQKQFDKIKGDLSAGSVKTTLEVIYGEIVSAVKRTIETQNIDLVIMGTNGASGFQEIFIGSNTEKVVRHSSVPVFSVRTAPDLTSIRKILLPSALDLNQTDFIGKVKELQEFFNASLHVLLINTLWHFMQDDEAKDALEDFARHYKLRDYVLHFRSYHNEEQGIIKFAHDEKVDMIAMGTHARKGLAHLFNGSITEDLVNHIHCPVWTYRLKK